MMTTRRAAIGSAVAVAALLGATACGTSTAAVDGSTVGRPVAVLPMATSVVSPGGTSWAAVLMGGSAKQHNNFWELFVRPAGSARWKLDTPAGVASNGGLDTTPTGADSLVAGFLPSQDLTFSPVATTADSGSHWGQAAPVMHGLATTPGALAAGPAGTLLALTAAGEVMSGPRLGASWSRLLSEKQLATSPAGRACGLDALTATGWTPAGTAMVAGTCSKPGRAGIFAQRGSTWQAVGPRLPTSLAHSPVEVLAIATIGTRMTAILTAGTGPTSSLAAAWSADGGNHWSLSPALRAGPEVARSLSTWSDGTAAVVLSGGRGETIGWQTANWQAVPSLPKNTATLAEGPGTQVDAIAARGSTMTVWQLPAGAKAWALEQTSQVPVPYGSSS
jgi:hypothetical protein